MSKNREIIDNLTKKNPHLFKDIIIDGGYNDYFPTFEEFFGKDIKPNDTIKNSDELVYANESNKNSK